MCYKEQMKQIFKKCQENLQCHENLMKNLEKIYHNVPRENFTAQFTELLMFLLVSDVTSPAAQCVSTFVTKFAVAFEKKEVDEEDDNDDSMNPFLMAVFDFLFKYHNAKQVVIRYRVCSLLNKILNELGTDASISEDLFTRLQDVALDRLSDTSSLVRVQAVHLSSWLQEPTNAKCPVVDAYLFHLSHDPHLTVRRTILNVIASSTKTIGPIMGRIRDQSDLVRKTAYAYLADKVSVRTLSIAQRVKLLTQGLKDRSVKVRKTVETKLLPVWMKYFEHNVEAFLHSLDIQDSSEIAEKTLQVLFKSQSPAKLIETFEHLDENHVIPLEKLTCEKAFHWRCLCVYIKSLDGAIAVDGFDDLVPNLTPFCEYIKSYVLMTEEGWSIEKMLEHEFVSLQLLTIASEFDLCDQAGRKSLLLLVKDLLLSPKVSFLPLIRLLLSCYLKLQPQLVSFMNELIELISEIREPITLVEKSMDSEVIHNFKMQIANITVELNILRDQQENCIAGQDFVEAQRLKLKITELEERKAHLEKNMLPESQEVRVEHNDTKTLVKCLLIAGEMLRTSVKVMTPPLQTLVETLVLPGIQNEDPLVRNEAVRALGLFCLRNVDIASQHLLLFMQISQVDQETICVTALRCVFDILLYFGLEAFQADGDQDLNSRTESVSRSTEDSHQDQAASSILSVLAAMLDSDIPEVRSVVAENIGKMINLGRIYSPQLFSRLIVLWYNPITESDTFLRHFLGVFIMEFAASGKPRSIECIEEAFMLTLDTVCNAPPSSPLSKINEWSLANFLIHLSNPRVCMQKSALQESSIHDRLAVQLCNKILKDPTSFDVRLLSKILTHLQLTEHNGLMDLSVLADEMSQVVKDKQSFNFIVSFSKEVKNLISQMSQHVPSSENALPKALTSVEDVSTDICSAVENVPSEVLPVPESSASHILSDTGSSSCDVIVSPKSNVASPKSKEHSDHLESSGLICQPADIQEEISCNAERNRSVDSQPSIMDAGSGESEEINILPMASFSMQTPIPTRHQLRSRATSLESTSTSEFSRTAKRGAQTSERRNVRGKKTHP